MKSSDLLLAQRWLIGMQGRSFLSWENMLALARCCTRACNSIRRSCRDGTSRTPSKPLLD